MERDTRYIIWNQLEILKSLHPADARDIEAQQNIVASGYTSLYNDLMPHISDKEADEDMQKEVFDILQMFRTLDHAKLSGWTPSDLAASCFAGFDGNNDDHYSFAGFLLDKQSLFPESAPNKNSHSSFNLDFYRRMLAKWDLIGRKYGLTPSEAEDVIAG